ncbi:glycosyltransferase family 2 protein [Pontibacter toksunensis]|uniref:Glycosyltransferase family 2 protein n=1 Tax=Pontibacter toksunensis TaxID=1332631 RepID=A0ABW6BMQ8_9BACT
MEQPLVSVLMTSFNREKYIAQAIESVLNSTYHNLELIIVDDGSKDKTIHIALSFADLDKRVKVFKNLLNLGDYPNRNKAASYAQGKYLKFVDADDMIYPHGLEVMVNMMENFPDAGYGLCSIQQDKDAIFPFELGPADAYRYHYFKGMTIFNGAPLSSLIKKEAFDAVNGFTGKRMVGDYELWHRLSLQFPVVVMPTALVWYRHHDEQESNQRSVFLLDALTIAEQAIASSLLTEKEKEILLNKIHRNMFAKLLKNPMKMPLKSRWQFFKGSPIKLTKLLSDRGKSSLIS